MFLINFAADFTKLKTKLKNIKYIEIKLTSNSGLLEFLFLKKKKKLIKWSPWQSSQMLQERFIQAPIKTRTSEIIYHVLMWISKKMKSYLELVKSS